MLPIESAVEFVWGGCEKLELLSPVTLQTRMVMQRQRMQDLTPGSEEMRNAELALSRGWLLLDAEARRAGHPRVVDAWIAMHDGVVAVISTKKTVSVKGCAVFTPSELLQFAPHDILVGAGVFGGRIDHRHNGLPFAADSPV